MSSEKRQSKKLNCPRCNILMEETLQRSYGEIGSLYECPKCKGII
ncbi:zf-TFIIB domain-containing protein [Metabacillus sp. KUDC1714]|uniref:Zf-TFIIB domain-containing protein n=1 Tax=Metabacillus elymi TaxID=2745198 RepID=A0ABX6S1P6_9BACI|nr:zf-TFIIB domain-containing protein [Metabacillus sp. KUDC1714]